MPTTIDCVVARAKRDSDPSTDAETNCDTLGAPAEQPDDQSDPSTDRDAEGGPEVLGLGHVVSAMMSHVPFGSEVSYRPPAARTRPMMEASVTAAAVIREAT
jgi:hypothetical protein